MCKLVLQDEDHFTVINTGGSKLVWSHIIPKMRTGQTDTRSKLSAKRFLGCLFLVSHSWQDGAKTTGWVSARLDRAGAEEEPIRNLTIVRGFKFKGLFGFGKGFHTDCSYSGYMLAQYLTVSPKSTHPLSICV